MLKKFKILPVVALGIFWMIGMDNAQSNVPNCDTAYTQCMNGTLDNWTRCEKYKDFDTHKPGSGYDGRGKPYIACCEGWAYADTPPYPRSTPSGCSKVECNSAKHFCDAQDWP